MDGGVEQLVHNIKQLTAEGKFGRLKEVLQTRLSSLSTATLNILLTHLDGVQNTFTLTLLLLFLAKKEDVLQPEEWITMTSNLFHNASKEHIRTCKTEAIQLAKNYGNLLLTLEQARRGVLPLKSLISLLNDDPTTFTAAHTVFAKLCLKAKLCPLSMDVINHSICIIEQESCEAEDVLCYLYYKGRIQCVMKEFENALRSFSLLLSFPTESQSAIINQAYKYAVIVNIIVNGSESLARPSCVSMGNASQYEKLWSANSDEAIANVLGDVGDDMTESGLNGLWKQALVAKKMHRIKDLTKTFVTLSISDIAHRANIHSEDETLTLICEMVRKGLLCAVVDLERHIVMFKDEIQQNSRNLNALRKELFEVATLNKKLREANDNLEVNEEYQRAISKDSKSLTTDIDVLGL
eukprot:m.40756 g.40756  ORF g.40756 m.40756 type:complete len:409 (+) comp10377_c0_seq7:244-1470(+)